MKHKIVFAEARRALHRALVSRKILCFDKTGVASNADRKNEFSCAIAKRRVPHIMVVTAEPSPSRIASLALGTGDIDCVYHFALYELLDAVSKCSYCAKSAVFVLLLLPRRATVQFPGRRFWSFGNVAATKSATAPSKSAPVVWPFSFFSTV